MRVVLVIGGVGIDEPLPHSFINFIHPLYHFLPLQFSILVQFVAESRVKMHAFLKIAHGEHKQIGALREYTLGEPWLVHEGIVLANGLALSHIAEKVMLDCEQ